VSEGPADRFAPGWGISPRWTSSAKTGIGTALNPHSRVWFTLSHGVLNEVYFPVDQACTRDMGLIVTDGSSFFSEEKRHCKFENRPIEPGVPVYKLTNTELQGRYRIEKEVFSDPYRNVVLQRIRFIPLQGALGDYRLYALLAPHLANCGRENTGWVGDYKGTSMLFARRNDCALAFACSTPGENWPPVLPDFPTGGDLSQHYQMTWDYTRAENGNVASPANRPGMRGEFTLALGFGDI
jgi:glucoamylase